MDPPYIGEDNCLFDPPALLKQGLKILKSLSNIAVWDKDIFFFLKNKYVEGILARFYWLHFNP